MYCVVLSGVALSEVDCNCFCVLPSPIYVVGLGSPLVVLGARPHSFQNQDKAFTKTSSRDPFRFLLAQDHPVHPVPARDRPGPPGVPAQLPDGGLRPHGAAHRQRLAAGRGDGRGGGARPLPQAGQEEEEVRPLRQAPPADHQLRRDKVRRDEGGERFFLFPGKNFMKYSGSWTSARPD